MRCYWKAQEILKGVEHANTFTSRLRGLLGRSELPAHTGLLITPCSSVHTLGMSFAIGVLFLDAEDQVCHVMPELRPGRLSPWVPRARQVLEVNPQLLKSYPIAVGDRLVFHA